jgi:hypothetical protein
MECSYRFKLLHIEKKGTFVPTPHVGFGKSAHASIEKFLNTGVMDPSLAHEQFKKFWSENEELFTKGPFPDWASDGFGVLNDWLEKIDKILADVPVFLGTQFPGWKLFGAEELLYESMAPKPISFKGYIDAVLEVIDHRGKKLFWIVDWKTSTKGWFKEKRRDFKTHMQLILYKTFWAKKHGIDPKDVRCGFAVLRHNSKPGKTIDFVPISVGPTTAAKGLKVIDNHVRSVSAGLFLKNRDSCRFCEFNDTPDCPSDF